MVIISAIQILTFYFVKSQTWFEAYEDSENKDEKNFTSYENTAVFLVSMFQYITEAIIFSKGAPYRRSIFSNCKQNPIKLCNLCELAKHLLFFSDLFMFMLVFVTIFGLFVTLIPSQTIIDFFSVSLVHIIATNHSYVLF